MANLQFPDLCRYTSRQLRSHTHMLSKVISLNKVTPGQFIRQPATAFLRLHNLKLKAAYAEAPIATATAEHYSSSFHNLLADVCFVHILSSHSTNATPASPCRQTHLRNHTFPFAGGSKYSTVHYDSSSKWTSTGTHQAQSIPEKPSLRILCCLYSNSLRPVWQISRALRNLPSLLTATPSSSQMIRNPKEGHVGQPHPHAPTTIHPCHRCRTPYRFSLSAYCAHTYTLVLRQRKDTVDELPTIKTSSWFCFLL